MLNAEVGIPTKSESTHELIGVPHGNHMASSQTNSILRASVVGHVHRPSGPAAAAKAVNARVWAGAPGAGARNRGPESRLPLMP